MAVWLNGYMVGLTHDYSRADHQPYSHITIPFHAGTSSVSLPMNELTIYGVCLAITVVLLLFGKLLVGRDFYLPFVIFPMLLAMLVMGEKVNMFSPNGGRVKP